MRIVVAISLIVWVYMIGTFTHGSLMWMLFGLSLWALILYPALVVLSGVFQQQKCDCSKCREQRLRQLYRRPTLKASSAPSRGRADRQSR